MKRWIYFVGCTVVGLAMFVCGLLVPAHLRAVDAAVVEKAGVKTASLVEQGMALVSEKKIGAAQLLLQASQLENISNRHKLGVSITNLVRQRPDLLVWGNDEIGRVGALRRSDAAPQGSNPEPFTEWVIRPENRGKVLGLLQASRRPLAQELLRFRALTNTAIFPPSQSASGQALDAAISICGILADEGKLTTGLNDAVYALASNANRGGNSQPLEQAMLDMMSLGQRFNWGQLVAFVGKIEDVETLGFLAGQVRTADKQLPVLFSVVQLSGKPAAVAKYLMNFNKTGLNDLGSSLRFDAGAVNELLRRNQRLHFSRFSSHLALNSSLRMPRFALTLKWLLYLTGGFLLAAGLHYAKPAVSALERPLEVRGFHLARGILFALGFLLVVLLLSEPFLAQESQKVELPIRPRVSTVGGAVPAGTSGAKSTLMNQSNKLTMLLFFVVQGFLYVVCVIKLAEIRRQRVPTRMKLKLLENEDHLFDAGLYLGFLGTIVAFILYSMSHAQQFSLMVAYSSTSFGILFVSFFKIFHLRPARRKLILEAEAAPLEREAPVAPHKLSAPL